MTTTLHESELSTTYPAITAAGAKAVLAAAEAKATETGVPVVVAVVDGAGVLKAYLAMDGVPPVAGTWAIDKAITAASFRRPTQILGESVRGDLTVFASVIARPHTTLAPAGVPLVVDGAVVGAVGVGGGTPDQDRVVAKAGVDVLGGD